MKSKNSHIFLSGGGSAQDSKILDKHFVDNLDHEKPLIYIPNAMKTKPYQACLEWFRSMMLPLQVSNIEMWDDLNPHNNIDEIAGIYIGGGDTVKLLMELRKSKFSNYLVQATKTGIPIYGGSAGAIILGENIRTAPEARELNNSDSVGIKIIQGYSIICHYNDANDKTTAKSLVLSLKCGIIAIPEKSGVYISKNECINLGVDCVDIFFEGKIVHLTPNSSTQLQEWR